MAAKTKNFRNKNVFSFDEPIETEIGKVQCSYVDVGKYCAQYVLIGKVEGIDASFYLPSEHWDALGIERPNADHVEMVNWGDKGKTWEMLAIAK